MPLESTAALARLLHGSSAGGSRGPSGFVALVGAGCSTASGIPDYRGEGTARRARNPIQHSAFLQDAEVRRRYWARSFVGWPRMAAARPNPAHEALAALEAHGLRGIITQNVDGLHHAAGSREVIELHGALRRVICLSCGQRESRDDLQLRLAAANPSAREPSILLADGDAEVEPDAGFRVVPCLSCGGALMPDVVFFGGSVPAPRVARATALVEGACALLVVGSSLTVYSGYRFVKRAVALQQPVAILNLGPTRADPLAALKIELPAEGVLPKLVALL